MEEWQGKAGAAAEKGGDTAADMDTEPAREIPKEEMEIFSGIMADINKEIDRINVHAVPPKGSFRQRRAAPKAPKSQDKDEKIASLEARLETSGAANDRLRKKNGELSNDIARMTSRANDLSKENERLAEENGELKRRLASIPKSLEESEERIKALGSENSALQMEALRLRSAISSMEKEIEAKEKEIGRLTAENEKMRAGIPLTDVAGKICRESATEFRSDLFSGPRYDVKIARDGSYMTFKADIEGGIPCQSGTLKLPSLPDLIGFSGPKSYDAYRYGGRLKIILRRGDIHGKRWREEQPLQKDSHKEFPQFRQGGRGHDPQPQHRLRQAGGRGVRRRAQQLRQNQRIGRHLQASRPDLRPGRYPGLSSGRRSRGT